MDKYNTELFGEFTYAEALTYEALIAAEAQLMERLDSVLQDAGADHIDFSPLGDHLMFQGAFVTRNLEILRDIAGVLAEILPRGVKGRIVCLEKDLSSYYSYWIKRGQWQEKANTFPVDGPPDAPVHEVVPEDSSPPPPEAATSQQ